jgi:hypothetical protein
MLERIGARRLPFERAAVFANINSATIWLPSKRSGRADVTVLREIE